MDNSVRGCHAFARLQAAFYKGICRFNASHYLHNNLDLRVIDDNVDIMDDLLLDRISREIPEIKNIFDIDLVSRPLIDDRAVRIDYLHNA